VTPDIIIVNASVLTMDPEAPRAEAVAIAGKEIAAVGATKVIRAMAGPRTRIIDAGGGSVVPGFIEGHMHLFAGAAELDNLDLQGVKGEAALEMAIKSYVANRPGSSLVIGGHADYTLISESEPLSRHHLDRILPDRPILVYSPDHHTSWANTIALEQAGILQGRKLGPGNEIVMGADGLATGELREGEASEPVMALATSGNRDRLGLSTGGEPDPYPNPEQFEHDIEVMKRGLAHCARHGITSVHNMDGNNYMLEILSEIERRGELTARVYVPFHFKNFMPLAALNRASAMAAGYRSEKIKSGFVKLFMDGVLDSGTAVMLDDYPDQPGWRGDPLFTQEHFNAVAVEADRRGLQIAVHAIGDGAVRSVLDGYEAAAKANGRRDSRHRVEHIEVVHAGDIPRFAGLGVIASMQPPHPPGNHGLPLEPTLTKIGEAKWHLSYAWNALREAGARLVFATDWPVSDINPLRSIQSALLRKKWRQDLPDNRQTLDQAIASYTREGAYAEFAEDRKGMLRKGFLADLVVLPVDLEKVPPETYDRIVPAQTICDGQVTFEAGASA
jgi:predicted amidohydrolase YtcJ